MSQTTWERRVPAKVRWWLWRQALRLKRTCPANAHGRIVCGLETIPWIDDVCRRDCERTGGCWCGKLGR